MKRLLKFAIITIIILALTTPAFCNVTFHKWEQKEYTLDEISKQLDENNANLTVYLQGKYGFSDYKKSKDFKFQVCAAKVYNCYNASNMKYFQNNISNVDKYGTFYFALTQNDDAKQLTHSIGQCESGYRTSVVSPDGGYGIFQLTPSAMGDPKIDKSKLLQSEYNTQQGIFLMSKMYKQVSVTYSKHNIEKQYHFIQYLMLRGYNGGYKFIDRIINADNPDKQSYVFSGNFIDASKMGGRFICFEKVNMVYPLKIYETSKVLRTKAF